MATSTNSGGIGIFGLLGVLFVGLKLGEVIDWSWWWVTLPFWGGFVLFFGVIAVAFLWSATMLLFTKK